MSKKLNKHLLIDLAIELGDHRIRPVYTVSDHERRLPAGRGGTRDLRLLSGRDNLRQAILMRLLTPMGELAGLGHADYGSRLHELVGQVNTDTTRNLMRLYIIESVQKEARVEKIKMLTVKPVPHQRSMVSVELEVQPVGSTELVVIGPFTFNLD